MSRIGFGWDCHVLERSDKPFMIGGVEIRSDFAPVAHSDGDALLHAIIDALLGAYAKGDIGHLFPPSDKEWKGASSAVLLEKTLAFLNSGAGGVNAVTDAVNGVAGVNIAACVDNGAATGNVGGVKIGNLDCTVVLESPRLAPYIEKMRESIAKLLRTDVSRVSVKAKTFESDESRIEAFAVVLLD